MIATDILVYTKDGELHRDLIKHLLRYGLTTASVQTEAALQRYFQNRKPAIILICANLKDVMEKLLIVEQIRQKDKIVPIIFITRYSSEAVAIAAFRAGVNDFFKTPISYKELTLSIKKNFPGDLAEHHTKRDKKVDRSINSPVMVGDSSPMRKVQTHILKLAQTDSTVLVTGETGTGKELATKTIHCHSPRCNKPLVCINCAAIPDTLVESELFGYERGAFTGATATRTGKFEAAGCGTIFLDEIGDMTPFAQAKILRTIEMKKNNRLGSQREKRLDFRVIAATNRDPEKLVTEKRFRKDLYYRLNVARVHIPPIRDRKEDIPLLMDHYIDRFNHRFGRNVVGFTESANNALLGYHWPGNVRELKNIIEVSFINLPNRPIEFIDLPERLMSQITTIKYLPENDRDRVMSALRATKWNKSKAAQRLKWSRMTLYRKMAKYNITEKPKI